MAFVPKLGASDMASAIASTGIQASGKTVTSYATAGASNLNAAQFRLGSIGNELGAWHARFVVYADGGGVPGALLAQSNELFINDVGFTLVQFAFTAAFSLAAGTYWLGVHSDHWIPTVALSSSNSSTGNANSDSYADGASDPFGTPSTWSGGGAEWVLGTEGASDADGVGASTWTPTGATTDSGDHVIEDGTTGPHAISTTASDFDDVSRMDLSFTVDLLDATHDWIKIAIGDEWGFVNLRTGALGDCSAGFMLHGVT